MRTAIWIVLLVGAATAVGFIVNANVQRDAKLFEFKWQVAPDVPLQVTLDSATVGKIVRTVVGTHTNSEPTHPEDRPELASSLSDRDDLPRHVGPAPRRSGRPGWKRR